MFGVFVKPFDAVLDRIDSGLIEGSLAATLPGGRKRLLGGRAPGACYFISFSTSPATTWPEIKEGGTPGPGTVSWPVK